MAPRNGKQEWEVGCELSTAMGYPMHYEEPSQIMDEIASTTPTFAGVSFAKFDEVGSLQWPCNDTAPLGTPIMHIDRFVRGKGRFVETPFVPTEERTNRRYPLILTTGRILSQYNVGAQTRRTENVAWHPEDVLDPPLSTPRSGARRRGVVALRSRAGETELRRASPTGCRGGRVYDFHHPVTGANVVTTEHSDWATNCPEYKVTAVQVRAWVHAVPGPDTAGLADDRTPADVSAMR